MNDWQPYAVAACIIAAIAYLALRGRGKKKGCGSGCGCGPSKKPAEWDK